MEVFKSFLPIILMIVVGYFIYKYYRNKKSKPITIEDEASKELWNKARWGLYIIIPFILIFDTINNDMTGANQNALPTIINFFLTRYLIKLMSRKGLSIHYPTLAAVGVSISIFLIQVLLGLFVGEAI
jgi:hypothetical protein